MSQHDDAPRKLKINGVYRHYKGGSYTVINVATHSETGEKLVIYRGLYGGAPLYARPYDMFLDEVNKNGQRYRFELVETESLR